MTSQPAIKSTPEELVQKDIDADKGLASKRKLLTVASLILMALAFSGAKVEEANTFLVKLSFDNQEGIPLLLAISIVFLMLRYYNYAQPYHEKLYRIWTERMLQRPPFYWYDENADEVLGYLDQNSPKTSFGSEISEMNCMAHFTCRPFFRRAIIFEWDDEYRVHEYPVPVSYFKFAPIEIRCRIERFLKHRENLDILAPYFIGMAALLSYAFRWVYMG